MNNLVVNQDKVAALSDEYVTLAESQLPKVSWYAIAKQVTLDAVCMSNHAVMTCLENAHSHREAELVVVMESVLRFPMYYGDEVNHMFFEFVDFVTPEGMTFDKDKLLKMFKDCYL